jgi:CBS domain containing-hemolysin-like protein
MDTDPPSDSHDSPLPKRFFNRICEFIGLNRAPDTAEDLEQEIQELLDEGEEHGLISSQEGKLFNSIFEFRDTLVHEVMTPRSEMICADVSTPIPELIVLITEKGFTRIPIHAESLDHVVGIVHAKDLLTITSEPGVEHTELAALVKPAYFVLDNKRIVDLLRDFQAKKIHMAIVTDEFGSVRGLVTLEDVLEEIVGEIDDEYDKTEKGWRVLGDGSLMIYARVDIEEVESYYKVTFPDGPYESVGGLIIHQLGYVPKNGETIEAGGLLFQVVSATKRHIKTVKISRL